MFNADRLKSRRVDLGLTLEDVGNAIGVTRSTVQKYEKGVINNLYTSTVDELAKVLQCTPAYLMGWSDVVSPVSDGDALTVDEKNIIKKYRQLDPRGRLTVERCIDEQVNYISERSAAVAADAADTIKGLAGAVSKNQRSAHVKK